MKESQNIEWKESWRDEYLKWICGFANAEGGTLVIGKNDRGEVVGVKDATKLLHDIPNKVRDILGVVVGVNLRTENGNEFLEIAVDPYPSPISYRGEYHVRSGSTKQELKGVALERFLLKKRGKRWDGVPEPAFHADDCSADALRLFAQRATRSGRMDEAVLQDSREAILENLELVDGRYLKRAACLLFSDRPERYVSGSWIKIGFFVTDDDLRYQDEIHGSLLEQVDKALEILHQKYLKAYISYEGLQRLETFLFPSAALREALLNAVVHKDYSSGIPVQISVYEHQIVFWNPGELPPDWNLERLLGKHPSNPYNPLLASTFFRAGYIESWGRGIEKINRECREHDIDPPAYDTGMSGLMLTFTANPQHLIMALGADEARRRAGGESQETAVKTPVKTPVETPVETRTKTPERILALLVNGPNLTLSEVAAALGKSVRAVERATTRLVKEGRLRFVGPRKGGHWEVLK
jgi:ATP-dependent DNA helicase RecG